VPLEHGDGGVVAVVKAAKAHHHSELGSQSSQTCTVCNCSEMPFCVVLWGTHVASTRSPPL
jgi:hypothetical protein